MKFTREEAALARMSGIVARADRPSQRRCSEMLGSSPRVTMRSTIELRAKADASALEFDGYASVTETAYEMWDMWGPYTEIVSAGAFAETLARADIDVPLVLQHEQMRRIARTTNGTLTLTEDDHGLHVLAELDPADQDVAYIVPKLRSKLIDEMSFAFRIDGGQWSPDYTEFRINKVDIHRGDAAIVGFGANPATAGSGLREEADLHKMIRDASEAEARAILTELRERFPARQPYVEEALLPLV